MIKKIFLSLFIAIIPLFAYAQNNGVVTPPVIELETGYSDLNLYDRVVTRTWNNENKQYLKVYLNGCNISKSDKVFSEPFEGYMITIGINDDLKNEPENKISISNCISAYEIEKLYNYQKIEG